MMHLKALKGKEKPSPKNAVEKGLQYGSAVKSTSYYFRGPEFSSWYPCQMAHSGL